MIFKKSESDQVDFSDVSQLLPLPSCPGFLLTQINLNILSWSTRSLRTNLTSAFYNAFFLSYYFSASFSYHLPTIGFCCYLFIHLFISQLLTLVQSSWLFLKYTFSLPIVSITWFLEFFPFINTWIYYICLFESSFIFSLLWHKSYNGSIRFVSSINYFTYIPRIKQSMYSTKICWHMNWDFKKWICLII